MNNTTIIKKLKEIDSYNVQPLAHMEIVSLIEKLEIEEKTKKCSTSRKSALKWLKTTCEKSDKRPVLKGYCEYDQNGKNQFVCTDSYFLACTNETILKRYTEYDKNGKYPDVSRIIPDNGKYALKKDFDFKDISLKYKTRTKENNPLYELKFVDENEVISVFVNIIYLYQCLNLLEYKNMENIKVSSNGVTKPIKFENTDTKEFFILCPVRKYH